mmetsp:Transcript_100468/g.290209  ORF Transcript_100468/g.290209 Transcript_100468/m.290209 type:complete len:295 (+) Transcript_100468:578-1462(+)
MPRQYRQRLPVASKFLTSVKSSAARWTLRCKMPKKSKATSSATEDHSHFKPQYFFVWSSMSTNFKSHQYCATSKPVAQTEVKAPANSQYRPQTSIASSKLICTSDAASCRNIKKYATNIIRLMDHLAASFSIRASKGGRFLATSGRAEAKQAGFKKMRRRAPESTTMHTQTNNLTLTLTSSSKARVSHISGWRSAGMMVCSQLCARGMRIAYRMGNKIAAVRPVANSSRTRQTLWPQTCSTATTQINNNRKMNESRDFGGTITITNINDICMNMPEAHKNHPKGEVDPINARGC